MHFILLVVYNYQEIHAYLTFRDLLVFATLMIQYFHTKKRFNPRKKKSELIGLLREVYCRWLICPLLFQHAIDLEKVFLKYSWQRDLAAKNCCGHTKFLLSTAIIDEIAEVQRKTSDFWNSIYTKGPTLLLIQIFFIEGAMQEFD